METRLEILERLLQIFLGGTHPSAARERASDLEIRACQLGVDSLCAPSVKR